MDLKWIDSLAPDEAKAALDSLDAHEGPYTVREVLELQRLKRALQAKMNAQDLSPSAPRLGLALLSGTEES
jgi:hypothetical protein